jgi:uncharacterized protein
MNIVRDNPEANRYEITDDDDVAGRVDYELDGTCITLTHTEMEPGHSGQGLAEQLVIGALSDARTRKLQVVPRCEYVQKVIRENSALYIDIVPEEHRDLVGGDWPAPVDEA